MTFIETMLAESGKIKLLDSHIHRLRWSMLQNNLYPQQTDLDKLRQAIQKVIPPLGNHKIRCLISWNLGLINLDEIEVSKMNSTGIRLYKLGIYTAGFKPISRPWNAKSNERDLYNQARDWALQNHLDDAIICNENGHIIESCIFNIFVLKDDILYTPSLWSMPVKGTYRTWLFQNTIFSIIEKNLTERDLKEADAIILTNALRGIQLGQLV